MVDGGRNSIDAMKMSKTARVLTLSVMLPFAAFAATSAQAMSPVPLHQQDGTITLVRHACGAGMHYVQGRGCVTTVLRRQTRRCLLFGAGGVCRRWG
jgi:hypothetical protein